MLLAGLKPKIKKKNKDPVFRERVDGGKKHTAPSAAKAAQPEGKVTTPSS